jgi:hypothetical protein
MLMPTFVQITSTPALPPLPNTVTITGTGQHLDSQTGMRMTLVNTMSSETGETLTMTESTEPFSPKVPNKAQYGKDEYRLETVNEHIYGDDSSVQGGVIINKNWCDDGEQLLPVSSTTSRPQGCPGLSWSLSDRQGHRVSCDYSYARGGQIAFVSLIFILPLSLVIGVSSLFSLPASHLLTSLISSLVFSSGLSYLVGAVFANFLFFFLSLLFLLLPALHLFWYIYQVTKTDGCPTTGRRVVQYLFDPPGAMAPLLVLSAREDKRVPYFKEIRCLPTAIQSSGNSGFVIGGWLLGGFAQLMYGVCWIVSHAVLLTPWLVVHIPWFLFVYFSGYLLYRLSLLQHQPIKERWFLLFLQAPDTHEGTSSTPKAWLGIEDQDSSKHTLPNNCISAELVVTSFFVLFFGLVGELVVQILNNQRIGHAGLLTAVCLILKCLFLLNTLTNFIFVYGSSVGPCLREITTSLFSLPSMFRSMANSSSPQPTESSSNEIQDLNFRIETLTKRLALYERDGEEEAKGGETNREEGGERTC